MLKQRYIWIFCCGLLLALLSCSGSSSKKVRKPSLRETYSKKDKAPFGAYMAYQQLQQMFYRNSFIAEKKNIESSWLNMTDTGCVYICIAGSLYSTDQDVNALLQVVENGNDVFLSANYFESNLLDTLGCKLSSYSWFSSLFQQVAYGNTSVSLAEPLQQNKPAYSYYYTPFGNNFTGFDSRNSKVLGYNENGKPNFIVVFLGNGKLFLHSEPKAFSNYFLLKDNNYEYLRQAFAYCRPYPMHVYWNEYYVNVSSRDAAERRRKESDGGSFSMIFSSPALTIAFWLSLALLLLYIIYGVKRRQREVAVVKPNENTTVAFTETIGRLYLQKKDNRNVAQKMITYFHEYLRNNFYLHIGNTYNADFVTTLSRKSGVERDKVEELLRSMARAHDSKEIDDAQLLSLNRQLQDFYKKVKS